MPVTIDGTTGITTPSVESTGASTFTGALALPAGGLNVGSGQLAVDASGRVTMASQPAFSAYGFSGAISNGSTLVFSTEYFDVGGNYNTANGRFTAPVAGKYLFIAQLFSVSSTTGTYEGIIFAKNGSGLNFNMYNYLDTTNDVFVTNTKIIDLAANDYVTVVFNIGSGGSQSDSRMTFDGFLIG